jgi:hypothetical protein
MQQADLVAAEELLVPPARQQDDADQVSAQPQGQQQRGIHPSHKPGIMRLQTRVQLRLAEAFERERLRRAQEPDHERVVGFESCPGLR